MWKPFALGHFYGFPSPLASALLASQQWRPAMAPWIDYPDLLRRMKEYDDVRFLNEVLGLPTSLGDHVISLDQLQDCCVRRRMLQSLGDLEPSARQRLVAGIDWGAGGAAQTALCIGYLDDQKHFIVVFGVLLRGREEHQVVLDQVAEICQRFRVVSIAADGGGNGSILNRELLGRYRPRLPLTGIRYAQVTSTPSVEGLFHAWSVDRTRSIGHLISRAKVRHIRFPDFAECKPLLEQIACETAEFDDEQRTIRYSHPPGTQDDFLHACNYALLQACRLHEAGIGGVDHFG